MRKHEKFILDVKNIRAETTTPPRTGVGTPDQFAEAAGAEIGADTGDVDVQRSHQVSADLPAQQKDKTQSKRHAA